jgi:hypothetical protein
MYFSTALIAALVASTNLAIAAPMDAPAGKLTIRDPEPGRRDGTDYGGKIISMNSILLCLKSE